ncbi:MAG: substrate-binding domain-containing protein [Phycisphaerae bacterium]|nr:substrate-binding domain-containing protein [Phycisphaerae bacterium]
MIDIPRREGAAASMRLVRELRRLVVVGHLGVGDPLPSIRELIEEKGVGQFAVRQALKQIEREGWAARRANGGKLWIASGAAECARARMAVEPPPIIFMLTSLDRRFGGEDQVRELERGFAGAFGACEVRQVAIDVDAGVQRVERLLEEHEQLSCETGYLLAGLPSQSKLVFYQRQVASVVLGHVDPELNLPSVDEDIRHVGYTAGRLLCHRKRAVVLFSRGLVGGEAELINGVRQAARELCGRYPSWDECTCSVPNDPRAYETAIDQLLQNASGPIGILAVRPPLAMAVVKVAARREIPIPEQVELIGYHHSSAYTHVHPEITSVGVKSIEELGRQAAQLLAESMIRPRVVARRELVESNLIERESTLPSDEGRVRGGS